MNTSNILAVADAIEHHSIPDLGFNMCNYFGSDSDPAADRSGHDCGTVACIAGYAVAVKLGSFDALERYDAEVARYFTDGADYLGISPEVADSLFRPDDAGAWAAITLPRAVAVLRHLAETGEVDWSLA